MRDRGKRELEAYNNNNNGGDYNFVGDNKFFPEFPCKKHPNSSSSSSSSAGGICAYCLTDRLVQLVCPQCGEQRLSSYCSCSSINSDNNKFFTNHDSSSSTTAADVGRISFLLENDKSSDVISSSSSRSKTERRSNNNHDDFTHLRRSNSISTAAVNNNGSRSETGKFWKIGRLFRKKRDKNNQSNNNYNNVQSSNNNNEENYDCNGVSRSRSLCSFRGFYDTDQENGGFAVSSSAARASSVSTGNFVLDSAKRSCFSESEARISNFDYCDASNFIGTNKSNIFSLKESEFVSSEDHAFIDLKLHDMSSESSKGPPDLAAMRRSGLGLSTKEFGFRGGGGGGGDVFGHEMFRNGGGSGRISSVSERELRKCRKSYKVWKWFFRHQTNSGKFDDHDFNS